MDIYNRSFKPSYKEVDHMPRLPTYLLTIAAISIVLLLSSCGQSGPLYVPGDPSRITVPPSESPSEDEETDEGDPSATG